MRFALALTALSSLSLLGCPPPENTADTGPRSDAYVAPGTDAAIAPGTDAFNPSVDASMSMERSWAAECTRIISAVSACTTASGLTQSTCETLLGQAASRGCQPRYLDALRAHINASPSPYVCLDVPGFGVQPSTSPSAPEFAVVGDACASAVSRPSCYSISCTNSPDCPGAGNVCNDETMHCTSGSCPGLPCQSSTDCEAAGTTCNSALGVCVRG
jgi:hypothetical protein